MSKVPPIQNLPPLSSIQDPAIRNYLQVLTDGWRVRNGELGDGNEKFLTVADLKDGSSDMFGGSSGGSSGGAGRSKSKIASVVKQTISDTYRKLMDDILNSKGWLFLEERIKLIERPEWFNDKFGTAIRDEQQIREDATSALAKKITTVGANLDGNLAMVREEITALVTKEAATASKVTTLATDFNSNVSYVQQTLNSISNAQETTASSVAQLQSTVNIVSATANSAQSAASAAQQTANQSSVTASEAFTLAQTIDGHLDASWSVKTDANGYVSGLYYGVTGQPGSYSSSFVVRTDSFSIGQPGSGQTVVPFFVQNGKTYINSLHITSIPLIKSNTSMWNGVSQEVNCYHGLGKFVIPVLAWDTPLGDFHSMVLTYVDSNSFRFKMYALDANGVPYTGVVYYGYAYI